MQREGTSKHLVTLTCMKYNTNQVQPKKEPLNTDAAKLHWALHATRVHHTEDFVLVLGRFIGLELGNQVVHAELLLHRFNGLKSPGAGSHGRHNQTLQC